ncbi:hypothetical protein HNP24_000291 [Chryseobacterium sediminis]|uniref:Uncharacterized protein n=1 Tax=Chryseobacterium sediminis TaxID=1679494 RepID=A0ABR6PV26_9FLAO|nr:hypothetical protein [Chryseobacterium sediminis]
MDLLLHWHDKIKEAVHVYSLFIILIKLKSISVIFSEKYLDLLVPFFEILHYDLKPFF